MARRNTTIRDRHRKAIAAGKPVCALCGHPIDYTLKRPHPMSYVADHIIPLDKGGPDTLANKQPAHWQCNDAKRTQTEVPLILNRPKALTRPGG